MRIFLLSLFMLGAVLGGAPNVESPRIPLSFEPNLGQADSRARFIAHSQSLTMLLDGAGAAIVGQGIDVRVDLLEADPRAAASGVKPREGVSNYLIGSDRSKWRRGVPHFGGVSFQAVYKGVDAVYYAAENSMEYDFNVAPGADPSVIRMQFSGAKRVSLDASGDLLIDAGPTVLRLRKPVAYQEKGGVRTQVAARYRLRRGRADFKLGLYDPDLPLVIDPLLDYLSYYGGPGPDYAQAITSDDHYTYIEFNGASASFGLAKPAPTRPNSGDGDIAIVAIPRNGPNFVAFQTFIGGSLAEGVSAMVPGAVASTIWLAGLTYSKDYPVTNGSTYGGNGDGILSWLSPLNGALLFSTYLGGSAFDRINGLGLLNGGVVVAGESDSPNFPVTAAGAISTKLQGLADGFVAYFQPSADNPEVFELAYSTYLGGSGSDAVYGLAVNGDEIIVGGDSNSTDFPTTANALSTTNHGGYDLFVSTLRLNGGATQLGFSTYIGGSSDDHFVDMKAAHLAPGVVIGGYTISSDFPITGGNPSLTYQGGKDGFVLRLDTVNGVLLWSTDLGGAGDDYVYAVEVDDHDGVWTAGATTSPIFPPGRPNPAPVVFDGWVAHLDPTASYFDSVDSIRGSANEFVYALRLDSYGSLWGAGQTYSPDLPTSANAVMKNAQPDTNQFTGTSDGFYFFIRSANQGGCDYQLTTPDDLTSAAQTVTLQLTTSFFSMPADSCSWRIVNGGTFTAIDGPDSGKGHATISVKVAANDTKALRQAAIYVGPRLALIRQSSLEKTPAIYDGGVVGAALSVPSIRRLAFNGLFTIFGTDFAPAGTALGAQLVDGALSTVIGNVCVTFNGERLSMINVYPGQITAVAPLEVLSTTGDSAVDIRVVTQCDTPGEVSSNAVTVPFGDVSPEFLYFKTTADAGSPVAAVDGVTGAPIGPADLIPGQTSPAKPGSIVTIYAVGFGDVTPSLVAGQPAPGAAQVNLPTKVFLNGEQVPDADVLYCGVTVGSVGLYQLNLQLAPDTAAGKLPLKIQLGTQQSPAGAYLTVGSK